METGLVKGLSNCENVLIGGNKELNHPSWSVVPRGLRLKVVHIITEYRRITYPLRVGVYNPYVDKDILRERNVIPGIRILSLGKVSRKCEVV